MTGAFPSLMEAQNEEGRFPPRADLQVRRDLSILTCVRWDIWGHSKVFSLDVITANRLSPKQPRKAISGP